MTTTQTTELAGMLHAKAAEVTGQPAAAEPEYIPPAADERTGEIVPVSTAEGSPPSPTQGEPPSPGAAVAPAPPTELPIPYPEIPPKVIGGLPYAAQYAKLARTIANTEMVPGAMRGRWDAVTACFMRGYEMGLGPMQALDSFHVIDGKVGLTAEAVRALIIQEGHQIRLSDVYDGEAFVGTVAKCHRSEWAEGDWEEYRFTMADAEKAGLLRPSRSGKPTNWQTYPRAMCDARATSGAGRRYFPDVLAGMSYTPEEIRDFDGPAEAPEQEATPSPSANAGSSNDSPPPASTETPPSQPPPSSPPPPPADAPEAPSATAPESTAPVGSTESVSATSPEAPAAPAPPTASSSTAKKARGTKKAAPSTAAPTAPAPAAATPSDAPPSTPSEAPAAGDAGVLRAMASGLVQVINGLPREQQPLVRAFIRQHYPDGIDSITDMGEMQAAIDIATGWPGSAETHPIPLRGEEVWAGFSTRVILSEGEYLTNCTLCTWALEEPATNGNLPEFRRLELAQQACVQHEQGQYEDGTPFCAGRPAQGAMDLTESQ